MELAFVLLFVLLGTAFILYAGLARPRQAGPAGQGSNSDGGAPDDSLAAPASDNAGDGD
ncbi:hypothetical protein SAMN06295905_0185 [Devosia lucknowensis]|uniref:Uncharacterized protein n=1 Tax=Devosia lucknowensis TaxID=1096929 RepID=A0A1Y6EDX4_9HYPH|nr:hypothetical protein [Devosia lucknowensis]SMQ59130.1 hypothetical protein SAMN06295905_0185 [Devosia lucknowensis]